MPMVICVDNCQRLLAREQHAHDDEAVDQQYRQRSNQQRVLVLELLVDHDGFTTIVHVTAHIKII